MINIVLDTSMLDTFQVCELKFDRRYNKNLVPPITGVPLDRGSIIHVGQEEYWKVLKNEPGNWVGAVEKGLDAFRLAAVLSDLDIIDPVKGSKGTSTTSYILDCLQENWEFWKYTDLTMEVHKVEQPFSYILYQDETYRIVMMGKIDLVFSDSRSKKAPLDHKSVDRDYGTRGFVNQFHNYAIATQSNILWVNKIGLQSSLKKEEKYKRIPVSFTNDMLDWWKANTVKWILRYYENTATDDWPANLTSCDKWNKPCEYLDVCETSGERAKAYKLATNFKVAEPWDVGRALESSGESVINTVQRIKEGKLR